MKRYSKWIKLALLVCVAVTIVFAPPSSLAYMAANSNTLHNTFRVVYLPPQDIIVPVRIQKSMVNLSDEEIGPGGFDFHLVNTDTQENIVATSADDGSASMNLTFTADDVGKTYHYRLYELNTGRENMTYDETIYDISISLMLNERHEMSAVLAVNGTPVTEIVAEYENKYYVPVPLPDTGDPARLMLWTAMLILSGAGLIVTKRSKNIFRRI